MSNGSRRCLPASRRSKARCWTASKPRTRKSMGSDSIDSDLEARSVSKRYASHLAVDNLSFAVERGSFFSILEQSGCGKTTLLRMIAGFLAPDAGEIAIGGKPMAGVPPNRRPVNMVFQHLALFPMMSVGENVGYGLSRRGVPKRDIEQRVG